MSALDEQEDSGPEAIPYQEYLLRVLFASFQPAVRLGVELNFPLDTIKEMMTLALWREAKAKHSTINLISLIFGKSTRTLKTLSARYNRGSFFNDSEMNLCRQVEDLLHRRPMSLEELSRRLPHYNEFDGASLAVQMLLKGGRITEELHEGKVVYAPIVRHHNLYSDDWESRIDALSEHTAVIGETLNRRFLSPEPDDTSVARTFTFQAREEDLVQFQNEVLEFIREKYRDLEEQALASAEQDQASTTKSFSLYVGMTPTPEPQMTIKE
jgi:hypothetical protein